MKLKAEPGGGLSGFLDRDTEITGDLSFKDTLRIDGKFKGSIRSGKSLVVGENGDVDAEIEVASLSVSGRLQGKVRATERIELHKTANVEAELDTVILVVEEGALFEGQCSTKRVDKKRPREEPSDTDEVGSPPPVHLEKGKVYEMK